MAGAKIVSVSEIAKHNTETDCWIVVDGTVYDITDFAPSHPGGPGIIHKYAGHDATKAYSEIHAASIIKEGLAEDKVKGILDTSTITDEWAKPPQSEKPQQDRDENQKAPLETLLNADDFEYAAKATATAKTWAFYSSADTSLVTRDANASLYSKIWFRPRVMRNVTKISTATTILGHKVNAPIMISPAAMAKLIHPDGELAMGRAAASRNIIQSISTNASFAAGDIVGQEETKDHPFFFQLYIDRNRANTERLLKKIHKSGNITAIMVTTDAAAAGKREADERVRADESLSNPMRSDKAKNDKKGGGYGRIFGSFIDPALCWNDLAWLRNHTKLPLLLKGVMSADDVALAIQHGLDGVMLSNHGGRNLDTSPPPILVLLECHARFPEIFDHHPAVAQKNGKRPFTILVDGGVRRGADILKCICLGAVACGLGRPFLFATSYGQEGVESLIDILEDELRTAMSNCGIMSLEQAGPELVNTGQLDHMVVKSRMHPYARDWRERGMGSRSKL